MVTSVILETKEYHPPRTPKGSGNPFKFYLRNCLKREHPCDLTLEFLKQLWNDQKGKCPYSGVKLILNTHSLRHHDFRYTASLDRIDNAKGYVQGNVQFISTAINFMKNTMSHEQIIEFLHTIAKNYS
jgi:hypothetical protein